MLIFHGGIKQDASRVEMQRNMGKWFSVWWRNFKKKEICFRRGFIGLGGKLVSSKKTAVTDGRTHTEGRSCYGFFQC